MQKMMTVAMALLMIDSVVLAAEQPKMKMTTEIPPGITTSDEIKTRLGDLHFFDGVPDKETVQKVYKFLDFQHAFQAYMSGIQIASNDEPDLPIGVGPHQLERVL